MTREELVKRKAQEFASSGEFSPTLTECFIAGAEWEHKRLVEKACEWLIISFNKLHNEYGRKLVFGNKDVFIEAFKKTMEE